MIFGNDPFTLAHVVISLVGIGSGFIVIGGLLAAKRLDSWSAIFLVSTVATSVSGFFFPFERFLPAHAIGILSLPVLAIAIFARYSRHLQGIWTPIYVVAATTAQYFNVFVLIAQLFLKVPELHSLAPTQQEPPFLATQLLVLVLFVAFGFAALSRYRVEFDQAV